MSLRQPDQVGTLSDKWPIFVHWNAENIERVYVTRTDFKDRNRTSRNGIISRLFLSLYAGSSEASRYFRELFKQTTNLLSRVNSNS